MTFVRRFFALLMATGAVVPFTVRAQIDPVHRQLVQVGYNAALQGHSPLSAYMFYYWNKPDFYENTNLTMRLAVAPTYLDSELGIRHVLGENTDLGIGLAGGGFADNYSEIQQGTYLPSQSFNGFGASGSLSLYHLFNPGQLIPLNGVLRGLIQYSTYQPSSDTAPNFQVPEPRETFMVRTGLRWGGKEPTLFPSLAMELSAWYQGEFRMESGPYGFDGDRSVNPSSQLFWGQALLAYTLPKLKHNFFISLIGGGSVNADRFSAYRMGALLPLSSEFPLSLPGYYYQELSAKSFVLLGANYIAPLDKKERWSISITAATAGVDYIPGLGQPGHWQNGVGGGILYRSPSWKILCGYAHGFEAIRDGGRGADSIGILVQIDMQQAKGSPFNPTEPNLWQGMQRVFSMFSF